MKVLNKTVSVMTLVLVAFYPLMLAGLIYAASRGHWWLTFYYTLVLTVMAKDLAAIGASKSAPEKGPRGRG